MRNKLIAVLVVSFTAGAASAQVTGSSGSDTNALWPDPAATQVAASSGNFTYPIMADPGVNQQGSVGLRSMRDEPVGPSAKLWLSDVMAIDGGEGRSFVDPEGIQVQREVLFHRLDLLLRSDIRGSPVYFGRDPEVKFVEHHDYQPGFPVPVGMSYPMRQKRWTFFTEFAPIFDAAPTSALGWGGGVGIRFYFGR